MANPYPLFVKRDLDGFFGLAIDNLVQLLLIVVLCSTCCGMTGDNHYLISRHILPGVAVSLVIGNLFYAAQAHWVARREKRSDVTALPYGVNTPSLLVYVYFVMAPAYRNHVDALGPEGAARLAWQMGLLACLGSGVIEFAGAFVAERIRRNTPRAALLSTLAGIAITFIAMGFALQIWQRPLVAMLPMAAVLLVYFSRARFPIGLPGGLVAVLLGTGLAWLLSALGGVLPGFGPAEVRMSTDAVREAWGQRGCFLPQWAGGGIWQLLREDYTQLLPMLSVVVPMGLFNVVGSLQNIESAEAGGDVFATGPSLAVNGIGSIAAAFFGSCFPTTIYIGHPGWKALGARAGYSTLNAVFITTICLTGTVMAINAVVPLEAGVAIVLWIGIVITAQAFQATPVRHAPAVAIGLFPAIAGWGAMIVAGAFEQASRNTVVAMPVAAAIASAPGSQPTTANDAIPWHVATMQDLLESDSPNLGTGTDVGGFLIHGMNILERGYILTCMIVAAISAFLIDRRYYHAAGWCLAAAVLTVFGLMHAYQLRGNVVDYLPIFADAPEDALCYRSFPVAVGYALMGVLFVLVGRQRSAEPQDQCDTLRDARLATGADLDREDEAVR